jgi:hypothetical protein
MTILPVVTRELQVASRRRSTYASRVVAVAIALVLGGWIMLTLPRFFPTNLVGAQLFKVLSWFAFVYALISGAKATADTMSSEKRQGTLGLLFLTDLKGYDVLLGKFVAASLDTFYALMAIMPLLALPLLMGGVTAGEFWRVALAVFGTLIFSLSAGMLASSLSFVERKATGAAYLIVGFACGGIPIVAEILKNHSPQLSLLIFVMSPSSACWTAFQTKFTIDPAQYYVSILLTFLGSAVLLALASRAAAHGWRDRPQPMGKPDWEEKWRLKAWSTPEARNAFRRRLLAINPIYWLASRRRHEQIYPWIFLVSMATLWSWGLLIDRDFVRLEGTTIAFYLIHVVFKIWIANIACYGFNTDRDEGAFEIIFSTPLRVNDILKGQWLALGRLFLWPFAALLALETILTVVNASLGLTGIDATTTERFAGWITFAILSAVLLVVDSVALGWLGLWRSLHSKTPHTAASASMGAVLGLPTVAIILGFGLFAFYAHHFSAGLFIALWFMISLLTDIFIIVTVCHKFTLNLRAVVSEKVTVRRLREHRERAN